MRLLILLSMIFGIQGLVMAAPEANSKQTHALMTPEEQEINRRARQKLYPGGRDEDPLRVQAQLAPIIRKMGPSSEAPADGPAEDPAPTDF